MAEIADRTAPAWVPTTNELDNIPDDLLGKPPAYLVLGTTPDLFEDPPEPGDTMTLVVRVRCKGFAGDLNADGKFVHKRKMTITAAWVQGQPEPPDADAEQPALFDEDGEPTDEPEVIGDILAGVDRPGFSDSDNA